MRRMQPSAHLSIQTAKELRRAVGKTRSSTPLPCLSPSSPVLLAFPSAPLPYSPLPASPGAVQPSTETGAGGVHPLLFLQCVEDETL